MRLHAFLLGQSTAPTIEARDLYQTLVDDTLIAESAGYDAAWFAEHHFSNYAMVPNSLTLIAALARETTRIRLGTSIILLPLRNPILVAEEIAMVDQLSGGRLETGFGRGYQPYEFDRLGVDFKEAAQRLNEGIDLLEHLFSKPDAAFSSSLFSVSPLTITPCCYQKPHPPFWVASGTPESIGYALDHGLNVVANVGNNGPELAEKISGTFHSECKKRSIDPATVRFALQTHGFLVESKQDEETTVRSGGYLHRVQVRLRERRERILAGVNDPNGTEKGEPTFEGWSSASLIGSLPHIEKQMRRFADLGVTDLFVTYRFGEYETLGVHRSMQAIAEAARSYRESARGAE